MVSIAVVFALFVGCNSGNHISNNNPADTLLLYKKDTLVTMGKIPFVMECKFPGNIRDLFKTGSRTLLIIENPEVITAPEGVYEIYLTQDPPTAGNFSSSQPGFVNVLDLYSFTAPGARQQLQADLSKQINNSFSLSQLLSPLYVSIHFGPVKLADGTYSSNAGQLRFTGISIVQVKD